MSGSPPSNREERPRVDIEPWPAGGWAIWVQGHDGPVSRHDTEQEAEFRARAYRRALGQGQELAFRRRQARRE